MRFRNFRPLMSDYLILITLITQGCSMSRNLIEEHNRICKRDMGVIIHDDDLWHEYRAQAESINQREIQ